MKKRFWFSPLFVAAIVLTSTCVPAFSSTPPETPRPSVTIMCYMNGDNDLSQEVLHALDMMEIVGSSGRVNVIALVDGNPKWLGPYDAQWAKTRLVHLQRDSRVGQISSKVLAEWGERDLGNPATLEAFVRTAIAKFPADRYVFYTFAHSQGIIDTRRFAADGPVKTLSISRDDTSNSNMQLTQYKDALARALNGRRFELMVLFSCLSGMVEVGYTLSEVTDYLVSSQDEIRLLNDPPGSYQIRGLPFESIIAMLTSAPDADIKALGKAVVDAHVNSYGRDVRLSSGQGEGGICRLLAGMTFVDCKAMPALAQAMDDLSRLLITRSVDSSVVAAMETALGKTQRFASFLNLEYYDLQGFIGQLKANLKRPSLIRACDAVLERLMAEAVIYERHTQGANATGMAVYLSHPLVPENIYQTHRAMYLENRFSRDTRWDEMIDIYRIRLREKGGLSAASIRK